MPVLLDAFVTWRCPNCKLETRAPEQGPRAIRYHVCPKLHYLSAPMVRMGTAAKVVAVERGDYVGKELVQTDPERGRPVQAIVTVRDNGQDTAVLAPTARAAGD